jgi:3-hydroxyacyl-[acyl-carrier-protein] dehydratase
MLCESFYTLLTKSSEAASFTATVSIDPKHAIFNGHFPGNPVVPGVCMLQIVKDLAEDIAGRRLRLKYVSNVKFIAVADPFKEPVLEINITCKESDGERLQLDCTISCREIVFLKIINAVYT